MKHPQVYIVGAPKAGSSSIVEFLRRRDIYFPRPSEVSLHGSDLVYRDREIDPLDPEQVAAYEEKFASAADGQILATKPVSYWFSDRAAEELHKTNPSARIIITLREPVALLKSYHAQLIFNANETETDFWRAIELEAERRNGRSIPSTTRIQQQLYYSSVASYAARIEPYIRLFGRENVCILVLEEMKSDPEGTAKKISDFVGIPWDKTISIEKTNTRRKLRIRALKRFIRKPPTIVRKIAHLMPGSATAVKNMLNAWNEQPADAKSSVSVETHRDKQLRERFKSDVKYVEGLIGRELPAWKTVS